MLLLGFSFNHNVMKFYGTQLKGFTKKRLSTTKKRLSFVVNIKKNK